MEQKLSYKLCKNLKNAGFPQYGDGVLISNPTLDDTPDSIGIIPSLQVVYHPTSEELVMELLRAYLEKNNATHQENN